MKISLTRKAFGTLLAAAGVVVAVIYLTNAISGPDAPPLTAQSAYGPPSYGRPGGHWIADTTDFFEGLTGYYWFIPAKALHPKGDVIGYPARDDMVNDATRSETYIGQCIGSSEQWHWFGHPTYQEVAEAQRQLDRCVKRQAQDICRPLGAEIERFECKSDSKQDRFRREGSASCHLKCVVHKNPQTDTTEEAPTNKPQPMEDPDKTEEPAPDNAEAPPGRPPGDGHDDYEGSPTPTTD